MANEWLNMTRPDCGFVNRGNTYIEQTQLIGKTTNPNGTPDSNIIDIGFHYPNWHYGENYLVWYWDFDESGEIGFGDLAVIANYWLEYFNFQDFAGFANQWRQTEQQLTPEVQLNFDQDVNSLNGSVQINVEIFDPNIGRMFLLMDGEKYTEIADLDNPSTTVQTNRHLNGKHSFKTVRMDPNGSFICSSPYDVNFNNDLIIIADNGFQPGKDFHLYGIGSGAYNVTVEDIVNESTIYTSDFDGNITAVIPSTSFTEQYGIYNVQINSIEELQGCGGDEILMEMSTSEASGSIYDFVIGRKFKKEDFPPNVNIGMVISIGSED